MSIIPAMAQTKTKMKKITYIYIKDDHQNPELRDTKINPEEELFKKSICDMVGCQCTALRSLTGTWHSRICDTRHYALCRRPHRHEHEGELEEASTEATFVDKHDEEEISGGAPVTIVRFWFAMPAVLAILTRLLLLPVIDNGLE
ncbi:hypothetical protein FJT64_020726 [Amphibalanus amphitrite]|uniref:Uncharacterized protein n=1 Tax=Amphibalanus amphitrite TaxID=1232801 RepID=A0A6A4WRU5_AMPAM|nr:hypothetical protein FJT64_020726 [Amphibalanus amphitrite]